MTHYAISLILILAITALSSGDARADNCAACEATVEMMEAHEAYARAWRDNDAEAVLATFADDFTLSPPGMPFVEGAAAAREFWWPRGAPAARILEFRFEPIQYSASAVQGYVRGHYELQFEYDGSVTATRGKFLTILERGDDGWKIRHHYWDALPADSDT